MNPYIDPETNILTLEPEPNYFGESVVVIQADDGEFDNRIGFAGLFGVMNNPGNDNSANRNLRSIDNAAGPRRDRTAASGIRPRIGAARPVPAEGDSGCLRRAS